MRGLLVNKFRGDLALFQDGVQILEEKGGVPVLGVIPYLKGLALPDEDAVAVETADAPEPAAAGEIDIAVLALPRIANFDDFDALRAEAGVRLRYVRTAAEFGAPQAVIIPGTKSTIADLTWLRESGLAQALLRFAGGGGAVVGICGGYQMLGRAVHDPGRVEASVEQAEGLGLLAAETTFLAEKTTHQARARVLGGPGWLAGAAGQELAGYEIHMGATAAAQGNWLEIVQRSGAAVSAADGAASPDGRIWGCYLHGLFGNDAFRHAWLRSLGWQAAGASQALLLDASLNALADAVEAALNMPQLDQIILEQ